MAFESTKELLSGALKSMRSIAGVSKEAAERGHQDLVRMNNQLGGTIKVLQDNKNLIVEKSKDDSDEGELARQLLEKISDENLNAITGIQQKILDRQAISEEEALQLTKHLESTVEVVDKLGLNFEVNMKDVISGYQETINDNRVDTNIRKDMVVELRDFFKDQGANSEEFLELQKLDIEKSNFLVEDIDKINGLITKTVEAVEGNAKKSGIDALKFKGTVKDLNEKFDAQNLTLEEMTKIQEQTLENGKSFKDSFLSSPALFAKGAGIAQGATATALGAFGLGGLDQALGISDLSFSFEGMKENMKKFGKGIKKAGSNVLAFGKGMLAALFSILSGMVTFGVTVATALAPFAATIAAFILPVVAATAAFILAFKAVRKFADWLGSGDDKSFDQKSLREKIGFLISGGIGEMFADLQFNIEDMGFQEGIVEPLKLMWQDIKMWLGSLLPELPTFDEVKEKIANKFTEWKNTLINIFPSFTEIKESITMKLSEWKASLIDIFPSFAEISQAVMQKINEWKQTLDDIFPSFAGIRETIFNKISEWRATLTDIFPSFASIKESIMFKIREWVQTLDNIFPSFAGIRENIRLKLLEWKQTITDMFPSFSGITDSIIMQIEEFASAFSNLFPSFSDIKKSLISFLPKSLQSLVGGGDEEVTEKVPGLTPKQEKSVFGKFKSFTGGLFGADDTKDANFSPTVAKITPAETTVAQQSALIDASKKEASLLKKAQAVSKTVSVSKGRKGTPAITPTIDDFGLAFINSAVF